VALCNDAERSEQPNGRYLHGDPTEGALLVLAMKAGLDVPALRRELPRDDEIPFESEQRFMATLHHDHAGGRFIHAKGAPERMLAMCGGIERGPWLARAEELAAEGLRVLAVAGRELPSGHGDVLEYADLEGKLELLGLVGLIDPPREEAVRAVRTCREAGIEVKMITGDHLATAGAVAGAMGIGLGRRAMLGRDIEALDDAALRRAVLETDVYARASPEHKLRLVEAMQAHGRVVAMTGDGVNDAPALKRADVGVAMGRGGTEVARRAAEMVLSDDNFASIEHAVEEGRTVYDNIRKGILFIMPTSVAEALMILLAVVLGMALPITPVQILWVNMITAVTLSIALAFEPAEHDIMRRPPRRPDEPLLGAFVAWRIAFVSAIVVAGTFGLFAQARAGGYDVATARTLAVNALVMFEAFYLINVRHIYAPTLNVEGLFGNRIALAGIGTVFGFELLLTHLPLMNRLFGTAPLSVTDWLLVLLVAFTVVPLVELEKFMLRRRGATL
jgi:magnesium-transporting ATPase (P-type)